MVYRKAFKYAVKKYPAVRKRYKVYAPALKQLGRDVMYLKGLVNAEPHLHTLETSFNYNWTGQITDLSLIPQGDQSNQRTGNKLLPRYLNLNIHVNQIALTGALITHATHRLIIFRYWGESTDAVPNVTPSDVLATVGTQYAPVTHLNDNNTGSRGDRTRRIDILRNEFFTLDLVSRTSMDFQYNIEMNKASQKNHIEFRSATTEQAISGGLFMLVITDNATAGDSGLWVGSRLTFYDN